MRKDKRPNGVNPPHNTIRHEDPALAKLRLYWDHKRADTLDTYFAMFPDERPPSRDSDKERGGR